MSKKLNIDKISSQQFASLIKDLYESGYINRKDVYKMSFIKGVLTGFGGVIGATIFVAILLWLLTVFQNIPVAGRLFDNAKQQVQSIEQSGN